MCVSCSSERGVGLVWLVVVTVVGLMMAAVGWSYLSEDRRTRVKEFVMNPDKVLDSVAAIAQSKAAGSGPAKAGDSGSLRTKSKLIVGLFQILNQVRTSFLLWHFLKRLLPRSLADAVGAAGCAQAARILRRVRGMLLMGQRRVASSLRPS